MQYDPLKFADTRAWLTKANTDLRAAEIDLGARPPLLEDALFHCQQAVEKTLKAFLTCHDQPFRKTHDLVELGGQCVALDSALETILQKAAPLTEYAWSFRYPGETILPTQATTQLALALAHEVLTAVLEKLPEEARP